MAVPNIGAYGKIDIYNLNTGALDYFLQGGSCYGHSYDLIRIRNSDLLASSCDQQVRVWKTTQPAANKFNLNGQYRMYELMLLSSDVLASLIPFRILLWNMTSTQLIRNFTVQCNTFAKSIDFSLDEKETTFVCSNGQGFKTWNWTSGENLNTIQTGSSIYSLAILFLPSISKQIFCHFWLMIDRYFFYELY